MGAASDFRPVPVRAVQAAALARLEAKIGYLESRRASAAGASAATVAGQGFGAGAQALDRREEVGGGAVPSRDDRAMEKQRKTEKKLRKKEKKEKKRRRKEERREKKKAKRSAQAERTDV